MLCIMVETPEIAPLVFTDDIADTNKTETIIQSNRCYLF